MIVEFQLEYMTRKQKDLIPEFLDLIVDGMKQDIKADLRMSKIMSREKDLLLASWIRWKDKKPNRLDMVEIFSMIINQLHYKRKSLSKETYIIGISKRKKLPGTLTPLETIARFLDRGNNVCPGTHFLSKTFIKYRHNINDYWKSFIQLRLKEVVVNECISIR